MNRSDTRFADRRILVVDDEERLAQSLASLLTGVGYAVESASSGPDGLARLTRESFDLVITDLRMEGVDGFDIMNHITQNNPGTALIVITGHASTRSAIEALHQRAADYITKPFDFEVLRSSIERVLAQQEADRLRRDMVNMLTHDIKVPLTNILGFAQLIATGEDADPERSQQFARTITLNCQKLLLMLENYLLNARIEEGRLDTSLAPVDVRDLVEDCLSLIYFEFEKKDILVDLNFGELPATFVADGTLLGRAINNLLNNAAKYTPRGETVRVDTVAKDGEVVISVANSGVRIPPEEMGLLFARYRRASGAAGTEGTGLGLHIVRSVAKAHGGRAWCECASDVVCFYLALPILGPAGKHAEAR